MRVLLLIAAALVALPCSADDRVPFDDLQIQPERVGAGPAGNRWQAGPLLLSLPTTWKAVDDPRRGTFRGPDGALVFILGSRVTPRARAEGYSVLTDPGRGPGNFERYIDRSGCVGAIPVPVSLFKSPGRTIMYADCVTAERGGTLMVAQAAAYSAQYHLIMELVGTRSAVDDFARALKAHGWSEPHPGN